MLGEFTTGGSAGATTGGRAAGGKTATGADGAPGKGLVTSAGVVDAELVFVL